MMMDTMKPYPEYKESGLPWLGCIPQHWEVRRNGRLFMQRNSTGYGHLPILEVSLKTGVRVRNMDNLKRKQVISDRNKYKWAAKGDIAYNMMRMWQGAVGVAPVDGLVSPAYVVVRHRPEVEPRYFSYLFRTDIYKKEVDGFSHGIVKDRNRLYWEDFKRIPSCFPSLAEQKIIADYLDANAAKIRRFIRNRRRLIEVLNEQKQAIISRAVALGIDPDVPLKPSGIDWLGDIPAHWEAVPLKRVAKFRSGAGFPVSMQGRLGQELPFFRVSDMNFKGNELLMASIRSTVSRDQAKSLGATIFPEGAIIFPKVGGALLTNKRRVLTRPSCIDNNIMGCVVFGAYRDFILLLLRLIDLSTFCNAGPVPAIGEGVVRNIKVPIPPIEEQYAIVSREQNETLIVTQQMVVAKREINLILEYRTRLISDVVTGKIDVRHLAQPPGSEDLEEAAEALEPLEDLIDDVEMDEEEEVNESD